MAARATPLKGENSKSRHFCGQRSDDVAPNILTRFRVPLSRPRRLPPQSLPGLPSSRSAPMLGQTQLLVISKKHFNIDHSVSLATTPHSKQPLPEDCSCANIGLLTQCLVTCRAANAMEREAGFETAPQPWRAALYQLSYSRELLSLAAVMS